MSFSLVNEKHYYLRTAVNSRVTMMKFKSLFRRGQPSSHQQSAQQQQSASLRPAPSASSLEAKNDVSPVGNNWAGSVANKEPVRTKATSPAKGPAKVSRMQELEREIEVLRKDRARLEANLRDAATDAQALRELRAELVALKVSFRKRSTIEKSNKSSLYY